MSYWVDKLVEESFLGTQNKIKKTISYRKKQMKLAFGEAGCVLKYLSNQSLKNPSFFQSVPLDNEEHITNMFSADARMIMIMVNSEML